MTIKLKLTAYAASLLALFLTPALAFAGVFVSSPGAYCGDYFCWIGGFVLDTINGVLVPVLFAVSFIVFLYGIAKTYIFSVGNETEVAKGHKLILYGIVAFAIMVSVWGLVNIVSNTFGLSGYSAPQLPFSPSYY